MQQDSDPKHKSKSASEWLKKTREQKKPQQQINLRFCSGLVNIQAW